MKTILILGAGQFQVPVIKKAKELGYKTIVTDYDSKAQGFKFADIALHISTLDKEKTLQVAKIYNIDGILTTSDFPVRTVAYVCKKMNLMGLSTRAAEISTDKFLLRECMKKNSIPCPKYLLVNDKKDIYSEKLKGFEFPLIIKPVDSSASRGVCKVHNLQELKLAYEEAYYYSKSGKVILEEFLDGLEYSVETLTQNGTNNIVAITEKHTSGYPHFVEDRHIVPAYLNKEQEYKIKDMINKVINAIGIDNSSSHAEIKLTKKGPILIEIGARLGGDYITSDLVPLSTGIDMLENIINISVGKKVKLSNEEIKYSGIQFITYENYEKIKSNEKNIGKDNSIIKFYFDHNKNNQLKSSLDRSGFYIACSDNKEELINILNKYIK
ncbi:ATP-grasp domain-containing protein [Clostridium cochlearium]|uniref:Carbamoyl-phosphate synthase large chain n=1 Tax=Clostridium cochlearium TaxID=1494 RepID=A0A2X2WIH1_CLOCO|nr:ATP-grasp domain-containing protein [Clostridium cochlearium]SQB35745.1 carbamoyl-phosphate synthase large chain [Clostridium cochlearium]